MIKTFFLSFKTNREIIFGGIVRGILFLPPYLVVPVILKIQGTKGLADYILITTILGILSVLEFGNSNNVVQPKALANDKFHQFIDRKYYLERARFRGFVLVITVIIIIFLYLLTSFLVSTVVINLDLIASLVVGTIGLVIGFRANVEAKIGIRNGFYRKIMRSYAISTFLSYALVFLVLYTIPKLYFMIMMQFVAYHLIMLVLISEKQKSTVAVDPSQPVTQDLESDRMFRFFAVAIPIQLNLVTLLTSAFLSDKEFIQIALILKLITLPSVVLNFAWTNQLWIGYAKHKISNNFQKLFQDSRNNHYTCVIIAIFFFVPFIFKGRDLIFWWTNGEVIVSESQIIWLSILGTSRILTVVSSALQVVFQQSLFTYITFATLILGSPVIGALVSEGGMPSLFLPSLIMFEVLTIGLTSFYWMFSFWNTLKEKY